MLKIGVRYRNPILIHTDAEISEQRVSVDGRRVPRRIVVSVGRNAALHARRGGLDHRYGVVNAVGDKDEATVR
jgi:hypothetical protein